MARLYFHLHGGTEPLFDRDGIDLPIGNAVDRALVEARALIAAYALEGRINLRQRLEVADDDGVTLHSLDFADAVEILH
jgi:hypothetical protein